MRDLIPGFGDRKTRERLDELFNRQTLGSVIFGGHLGKIVEKVYNLVALTVVLTVLGVDMRTSFAIAAVLLLLWVGGIVVVIYVFVKWESVMASVDEATDAVEETADDVVSDDKTE